MAMDNNSNVVAHAGWKSKALITMLSAIVIISLLGPMMCGPDRLVPFSPNQSIENATYLSPLSNDDYGNLHVLGTDRYGRDVLSRIIYGSRTALLVGAGTVVLSFFIALIFGIISGYFGDRTIRFNLVQLSIAILTILIGSFYIRFGDVLVAVVVGLVGLMSLQYSSRVSIKKYYLPLDTLIIKLIEIVKTIPALFIVISLFAIFSETSLWSLILILGLISWPGKARLLRAEVMKTNSTNYIFSVRIVGLSDWVIIKNHLLPNVLSPLIIACCYTFTGAILAESTLSFLNVGLPQDIPSWGGIMRESRDYFSAWWLAVFPGSLLFITILALNILADRLNDIK